MTIQAFIDDSEEAGEVLVLAGYICSADEWIAFSRDWQERLDHAGWKSVHMADVAAGDPSRMETAGWFYRAIEKHVRAYIAVAVEIEPLRRIVTELGFRSSMEDPRYLDNPYILGFRAILDFTAQYQHELGITEPIDFIFDERGEKKKVREGFEIFKNYCREEIKGRLGKEPRFEDDEDFPPLQAADIFAWHVRKHWLRHRSITNGPLDISWVPQREIVGYCFNMDYADIQANMLDLKKRLIQAGYRFRQPMSISVSFSCDLSWPPTKQRG